MSKGSIRARKLPCGLRYAAATMLRPHTAHLFTKDHSPTPAFHTVWGSSPYLTMQHSTFLPSQVHLLILQLPFLRSNADPIGHESNLCGHLHPPWGLMLQLYCRCLSARREQNCYKFAKKGHSTKLVLMHWCSDSLLTATGYIPTTKLIVNTAVTELSQTINHPSAYRILI